MFLEKLLANIQFWYVKKRFKIDKDYQFYHDLNDVEAYAVKYLRKYTDTIVEFKNVEMKDGNFSFDFVVVANPKLHNTESKAFKNFTSNVMRSIIMHAIDNAQEKPLNDDRTINPDQFDQERTIHEESDPVLEARVSERKPRKKTVRRNKKLHTEV